MPQDFLIENDNEIIRNIHNSDLFIQDSFEVVNMAVGIMFIVGKPQDPNLIQMLINPDKLMVQSVKFKKPAWILEDALDWLKENQRHFKSHSAVKSFAADLKSIKAVEIFSAGTWNGDKFTTKDLDKMVEAFDKTSESIRPFLKLGHSKDQKLLEAEGLPAAGWVGKMYRKGEKLLADFIDIPGKVFELIENKSYRSVSIELFFGAEIKENSYDFLVTAVALLGAETPGVMNLDDILARFGLKDYNSIKSYASNQNDVKSKTYSIENENNKKQGDPMPKSENELKLELQLKEANDKIDASKKENTKFKADIDKKDTELKDLNDAKKLSDEKADEMELKAFNAEIEKQADSLVASKTISKAMRPYAVALLKNDADKETKKFSFKAGKDDKEEKTLDRFELIKEFASLNKKAAEVNFDDNSEDGKIPNNDNSENEIKKFMTDNEGATYADAYRAVNEGKLTVDKPHVNEN